ncbi:amidohydrolase [Corallincola holothuriorum]|uniref:Amidohydrolase n=1 Tax=Corallincola holothuriorum TaxID=2282215 RepID=A0A368NQT6_9GAMM|nr:amidohydrolase [Corallincola holothuriorum]
MNMCCKTTKKSLLKTISTAFILCLISLSTAAFAATKAEPADVVYKNGYVYTVNVLRQVAEGFAMKDGKFIAVGSDEEMKAFIGKKTKVVNLKGKMVMPGLVDSHIHALRGALTSLGLAFPAESSVDEIKTALKKFIKDKKLKKGDWIEGAKWSLDYHTLTAAMLDEIAPDNPVFLHDWTNHLAWVNSAALEAANITKDTPDPAAGVIDRDSNGVPTGTLHDKALGLITAVMPEPAPKVVEERAQWIFSKLNKYGVTAIITPQLDPMRVKAYRDLEAKGKLTVRIQGSWDFNTRYVTTTLEEQAKTFMTRDKRGPNSPLINVDGVKIYMDGVPNDAEGGSPMIDSYATAPTFGTPSIDESTFSTWMMRFDKEGIKVMAHATGSLSVRHFLNAIEATRRANGKGPRHHMAHSMLIYPDEVPRFNFEKYNFVTEVSPYQVWTPDPSVHHWAEIIGEQRFNQTMTPLKSIVDAGALVSYGSDWDNIANPDPWFAMEGMVTRQYPGQPNYGQLNPDERIDISTAIQIFTRNGIMAMEKENESGSIEVGKSADFIIIDQNLLQIPVQDIHKTKVLTTVLQGKTVYKRK